MRKDNANIILASPTRIACILSVIIVSSIGWCEQPTDYVNPMVGTVPSGHVYPGATVRFGMVQVSPDTRFKGWDGCSGYDYDDSYLYGFSFNHFTGTGAIDLGNVRLIPTVGKLKLDPGENSNEGYRARFSHKQEEAHPGYYSVFLPDYNVMVELTATTRVGMQRYTFNNQTNAHVVLDLWQGVGNQAEEAAITIENDHTISGYRTEDRHTFGGSKTYYYFAEFSKPFEAIGINLNSKDIEDKQAVGRKIIGHFDYKTRAGEKLVVKVALSTVSVAGARKNLEAELPGWSFDDVATAAKNEWNTQLNKVRVESEDTNLLQTFYTALYHTQIAPIVFNDVDGQFRGPDGKVHQAHGFDYYTSLSVWDTFRAEQPLLTLIEPRRVNDIVRTMLEHYKLLAEQMLPDCAYSGKETFSMIGNPSIPVIAEAYNKGLREWDPHEALSDMVGATERNDEKHGTFKGYSDYRRQGWIPVDPKNRQQQCVSKVLEFAYEDACVARFARSLERDDIAAVYARRSTNWQNVYNYTSGFMQGRDTNGDWVTPFEPTRIDHQYYTEANAWQYNFFVPHNIPGLIKAMGGEDKFVAILDEMFDTKAAIPNLFQDHDVTGIIGMYAQGNEPCHNYAYLFNYAGRPWKTQFRVRQITTELYDNTPGGLCGNDDCGQLSAWYVFAALGFYPVDPPTGVYVIGSPLVDKAIIQLDSHYYPGGSFTVIARNNSPKNVYIQSADLNGKTLTRSWITHDEIVQGGTLELTMGPIPNRGWGSAPEDRPAQPLVP
jgi:predicted alpha-1,2-mannosidase